LLAKNKRVDILLMGGFNWGRKSLEQIGAEVFKYRNVFFAPKIKTHFRIHIKKLTLAARAEYQLDVTNPKWKYKSGQDYTLDSTKFNMFLFSVGLGFNMPNY